VIVARDDDSFVTVRGFVQRERPAGNFHPSAMRQSRTGGAIDTAAVSSLASAGLPRTHRPTASWRLTRMHDTDDIGSNESGNPHLQDMIEARVERRTFLKGTVAAAATGFIGSAALLPRGAHAQPGNVPNSRLRFTPIEPSTDDAIRLPQGYTYHVLAPWGTPLLPGAPAFAEDASNTAADQELQVGFNHDGTHYFPLPVFGDSRGLLVMNHEYTDATQIYSVTQGSAITPDAAGREKVAKALAAHGVSVISIQKGRDDRWSIVQGDERNRRITGTTPMAFSGPVSAGHPMLASTITPSPLGTLNNCAMGYTPWGTYLACEENWNGYFGTDDTTWRATALEARYGVSRTGFGYNWHKASARFDLARNRNELNHFGWVVEFDPYDPTSQPVKRTALGRVKHEGATCTENKGRIVVYTGDDENGDYLYRFVGSAPWRQLRARGLSPLDHGTLYVAQFDAIGGGRWLPLVHGTGPLTTANGWADQADVLIRTRMAADAVGATRLHRPEWVAVHPHTNEVFVTLTNGSGNGSAANGNRDPNPYGHIVRFREASNDDTSFEWDIFLLAGDPAYDSRVPADQPIFGSPDGIWVDRSGIVWVQTDISNSAQNLANRGYDRIGNNQMLAADPDTGEVRRFLTGPRGCEITGVTMTPDQRTMFVNIQHPGEPGSERNDPADPRRWSNWPDFRPDGRPRSATLAIRKDDGGVIGT
jgi:secreted PhoX family phosphatase